MQSIRPTPYYVIESGPEKVKRKPRAVEGCSSVRTKIFNIEKVNLNFDMDKSKVLNNFSKVRENYFKYLQNVIKENLESTRNPSLGSDLLEKISMEVEQPALLACLQSQIYQENIIKIIHDIKKSTQKMKLHLGIEKILLSKKSENTNTSSRPKTGDNKAPEQKESNGQVREVDSTNGEFYSPIPTISSTRVDYNEHHQSWYYQNVLDAGYGSFVDNYPYQNDGNNRGPLFGSCEAQDVMQPFYSPSTGEQYVSLYNYDWANYSSPTVTTAQNQDFSNITTGESEVGYVPSNLVPIQTGENYNANMNETNAVGNLLSDNIQTIQPTTSNSQEWFGASTSQNQIRKRLEGGSERNTPQAAAAVENTSESDTPDLSSDSDETNRSATNRGSLLSERLEIMRQRIGIRDDDEGDTRREQDRAAREKRVRSRRSRTSNRWYHEKTVNLYRLSQVMSELSPEMRRQYRSRMYEYFGEDSDDENEICYIQEEKYIHSCKERIAEWIVRYLMPFYKNKRIVGRNVFKALGHHVSNNILEKTNYPDEWTVKYVISKYFAAERSFLNENDVSSFRPQL